LDSWLFRLADFLGRPPGFYLVLVLLVIATAFIPLGGTNFVNYLLSVSAIVITGVVLIQGYRDTAAMHAKLDEIIVALDRSHNELVGLEHEQPAKIQEAIEELERRAGRSQER